MSERVTILGNGAMGTVCSILLDAGGHDVVMWGASAQSIDRLRENRENTRLLPGARVPDRVRLTSSDQDCFDGATLVVSAIPTQFMRATWRRLAPHLPPGVAVVSTAKGIELDTLRRPTEIVEEVVKAHGTKLTAAGATLLTAALSGPNIAAELARRQPASSVVACADEPTARRVQRAMTTPWFRLYTNTDVLGVELAGASKNVVALAAGMVDGLGVGNNAKASLVTRGLVEITRLGVAMGARPDTFMGLAGLGDLITTCVSPEGRNRAVGEALGRGERLADILARTTSVAEGVPTTEALLKLARRHAVEMPITEQVHQVLFAGKDVPGAMNDLMSRGLKGEIG